MDIGKKVIFIVLLMLFSTPVFVEKAFAGHEPQSINFEAYVYGDALSQSTPDDRIIIKWEDLDELPIRVLIENPYNRRVIIHKVYVDLRKDDKVLVHDHWNIRYNITRKGSVELKRNINLFDYVQGEPVELEGDYDLTISLKHTIGKTKLTGYFSIHTTEIPPPIPKPDTPMDEEPPDDDVTVIFPPDDDKEKASMLLDVRYGNITEDQQLKIIVHTLTTEREMIKDAIVVIVINNTEYVFEKDHLRHMIVFQEHFFKSGLYEFTIWGFSTNYTSVCTAIVVDVFPSLLSQPNPMIFVATTCIGFVGTVMLLEYRYRRLLRKKVKVPCLKRKSRK